jgi:hypothetical protein
MTAHVALAANALKISSHQEAALGLKTLFVPFIADALSLNMK